MEPTIIEKQNTEAANFFSSTDKDMAKARAYWYSFYAEGMNAGDRLLPSDFCLYCIASGYVPTGSNIADLGCGNGRDSVHFARSGFNVVAVDQCTKALELTDAFAKRMSVKVDTKNADFSTFTVDESVNIYSRFSLHAINNIEQQSLLKNVRKMVGTSNCFMIEARTTLEFGEGFTTHREMWEGDHYRRYLHVETLCEQLVSAGFQIEYIKTGRHMAVLYGVEDPHLVRIIAK